MPGRWMDERDRYWRDQDEIDRQARRYAERRSWEDEDGYDAYAGRTYGREDYRRRDMPGGAYPGVHDRRGLQSSSFAGPDYGRGPTWGERDRYGFEPVRPYDHESGYVRRGGYERGQDDERFEERAREAGRSLRRMGERVAGWFDGLNDERRERDDGPRRYRSDFGREARWMVGDHRGRGPKDYRRSDERISDEVHARLTDDPWIDASQIDVAVSAGEVTLTGAVENRQARRRAEDIVEGVFGVSHVQNDLRVGGSFFTSAGSGFGDSVLEAQMRRGGATGEDSAMSRTTTRRS